MDTHGLQMGANDPQYIDPSPPPTDNEIEAIRNAKYDHDGRFLYNKNYPNGEWAILGLRDALIRALDDPKRCARVVAEAYYAQEMNTKDSTTYDIGDFVADLAEKE